MDDPDLPRDQHEHALAGLARLNRFTRIAACMYRVLRTFASDHPNRPLRVLDIASGSGDLPIAWMKAAKEEGLAIQVTATDISAVAIKQQQSAAAQAGIRMESTVLDCLSDDWPSGFDVVTNSLFLHHLSRPDAIRVVRSMMGASQRRVLVCDLERSQLNRVLVGMGSHLLTRSHIVHVDAKRSVEGAFSKTEMEELIRESTGISNTVRRLHPCRLLISLDKGSTPVDIL